MDFPPYVPLPDAELICVKFLSGHPTFSSEVDGRISTELPQDLLFPCVTLSRIGGSPTESLRLDRAAIQVQCWGNNKREAFLVASKCRAALFDMRGYREDGEGYVTGVRDLSYFMWMPDDSHSPTLARYIFDVAVYTHP
jgi:hypothetical protein